MSKRLTSDEEVLDASANKRIHLSNGDDSSSKANGGAAPILHSVPKSILPILHQPYQLSDFFTDVDNDINNPKINKQVSSIVKYFPPPAPNFLSPDFSAYQNGLMIPFIYPPPPAQKDAQDDLKVIPPLPFPPPNYMPYPLVSENSTLNPKDVFKSFLDALAKLPRIDMVVASAAGSLYDMKAQAGEEGFTISEHEEEKEKLRLEKIKREDHLLSEQEMREQADDFDDDDNDDDAEDDDHLVYDDEYEDYKEFASNVDITDVYDKNDKSAERNIFELRKPTQPGFSEINSNISNVKRKKKENSSKRNLHNYNEYHISRQSAESEKPLKLPISSNKLTTSTSPSQPTASSGKDKDKRNVYLKNLNDIQEFEKLNETEIYIALKKTQLERLKKLNESKILFNGKEDIHDEELNDIKIALEESRDIDLVGMKLLENYELLNNALVFYQDSNKSYKHMNSIMINKLMKLKNFFEYQRDMFKNQLLDENSSNLFDIKTKDSAKLFAGISQKDIATFLREEMKKEQSGDGSIKKSDIGLSQYNKFTPTSILLVHDFMPLINLNEFNLITGELPNHKYKAQQQDQSHSKMQGPSGSSNIKHQIFKSSLYDPMTSGSDTNGGASDVSNITAPKRRGRRAANSSLNGTGSGAGSAGGSNAAAGGGGGSGNSGAPGGSSPGDKFIDSSDKGNLKYSETLLLARIMKHYIPPQGARQDELVDDLESMGVQTKWPLLK